MKQLRPIYEIFAEAKSEMYKKLDELRKEMGFFDFFNKIFNR